MATPVSTFGLLLMVSMNKQLILAAHLNSCVTGSTGSDKIPSFVGQNYFCETGLTRWPVRNGVLWPDGDPLWDGEGCGPTSSCCTFNSPPWFNVQLLLPTNDNIEVRICGEHGIRIEDTPIQLIEIYVK